MYMRNSRYNNKYNIDGFPPNYAGQWNEPEIIETDGTVKAAASGTEHSHNNNNNNLHRNANETQNLKEIKTGEPGEKKDNSLFGGLFKGNKDKDGKKNGGLLSGLFNRDGGKDGGGFLSNIAIEDLILIAVIFFLLKDGFEDDLILILAIILFTS